MATAGIVAEYNPFHRGHAWHIARTRRTLGADTAVICVMSGHWVQRGECALTDKWSRAALALSGGADLVLELPTPWAMASAEAFARGAVGLLAATGVVDVLSFGSETGELAPLRAAERPPAAPYVRVLGLSGRGRELLRRMKETCALPVVVKPAQARALDGDARALFEAEARRTDLFGLCFPTARPCGLEWTRSPVVKERQG